MPSLTLGPVRRRFSATDRSLAMLLRSRVEQGGTENANVVEKSVVKELVFHSKSMYK